MGPNEQAFRPLSGRTYCNPLPITYTGRSTNQRTHPDPYILSYNGEYYAYATGDTVPVLHSTDLVHWTDCGAALDVPGQSSYWAPCVLYDNGVFYMYYSSEEEGTPQLLKVASSDSPLGPFRYRKTLFDVFSIDAHVVRDEIDGSLVLFYVLDDYNGVELENAGTVIMADRLVDPLTPAYEPMAILHPTIPEEVFQKNRYGDGRDWHTIEGPFYFTRGGYRYLQYSGSAFWKETYFIGYAWEHMSSPILSRDWVKFPSNYVYEPLLRMNGAVEGVGHNSMTAAPNLLDEWVFYHGRDVRPAGIDYGREERVMRMDPLLWLGDDMWVPGPSHTEMDAPGDATLRDQFREPNLSEERWRLLDGSWQAENGEMTATPQTIRATAVSRIYVDDCVVQVSVRLSGDGGGRAGLLLGYRDEDNHTQILLDKVKRRCEIWCIEHGTARSLYAADLGRRFVSSAFHVIRTCKKGGQLSVWVDGQFGFRGNIPSGAGAVGLMSQVSPAAFAGFAMTHAYETRFEEGDDWASHFIAIYDGHRTVPFTRRRGGLMPDRDSVGCLLTAFPLPEDAHLSWHITLLRGENNGAVGILPMWQDEDNYLAVTVTTADSKIQVRQQVQEREEETHLPWMAPPFPCGLTFTAFRKNNRLRVFLGKQMVYDGPALSGAACGFIAEKSLCRFDYFSVTDWV